MLALPRSALPLVALAMLSFGACGRVDLVGRQCSDTSTSCTTDSECVGFEQGACADSGACAICAELDGSLVAWYAMELPHGEQIADSSPHGHHGACASQRCPLSTAGAFGDARSFDGADLIVVPSAAPLITTSAFTASAWIMRPAGAGGCAINKAVGATEENSWQACVDGGTGEVTFISYGAGARHLLQPTAPVLSAEAWHHLALRWDGATKSLFIDGVLAASATAPIAFDTRDVTIGADLDGTVLRAGFRGAIDDVRIYARALAAEEIAGLAER